MKKTAYLLLLILLAMIAGCDLFKPDDNDPDDGWIDIVSFDFPMYMGHFADYEHTDANGNSLGSVTYGEHGDDNDWQVFEYDPADRGALPIIDKTPLGTRDEYHIRIEAVCEYNGYYEIDAAILFHGTDTGFFTPHTFSYQGAYNPALEDSFLVSHLDYEFPIEPQVSFAPETNTYTYRFSGVPVYIVPPWQDFTAIVTEQAQVRLAWVTWSETALTGFRVYRSDSDDISTALEINPELIPATNTSELHSYTYTDTAVDPGNIYFYWLEKVYTDNNNTFHGPVSVSLPPVVVNDVGFAYPNPCQDSFYLNIDVKLGTTATVLLLDAQHVIRKTYQLEDGSQLLNMDVSNLEPGLYRTFIWFADGHYAYGDVLIQD